MELNERKRLILKSIIDAYIDSGEPIGSKFLSSHINIPLSPATIRNEMSELEDLGYLDKPHTSAGRIPSSSAYRLYVNQLMESYRLTIDEINTINNIMQFKLSELDKIISRANKIMSDVTHCVALSLTESPARDTVSRFDAVSINTSGFLLVIITSGGDIKSEHVNTPYNISGKSLEEIKNALNKNLTGILLEDISISTIIKLEQDLGMFAPLANPLVHIIYNSFNKDSEKTVNIDGLANLLSYPEFSDIDKLRSIINVFDHHRDYIKDLLTCSAKKDNFPIPAPIDAGSGLKIYIGDDENSSVLSDTSLVFCTIPVGNTDAVIGILGPKRMDYKKAVSTLKKFTENIENAMNQIHKLPEGENND